MKDYAHKIESVSRKMGKFRAFWSCPHGLQDAALTLANMRRCMDALLEAIERGSEEEHESAATCYRRLSHMFTDEVLKAERAPIPKGYDDDT